MRVRDWVRHKTHSASGPAESDPASPGWPVGRWTASTPGLMMDPEMLEKQAKS